MFIIINIFTFTFRAFNIWDNVKRNRKYPDIKVGDEVRVMIKKDNKTKGYFPKWSVDKYTITFINKDNEYLINDKENKNCISVMRY